MISNFSILFLQLLIFANPTTSQTDNELVYLDFYQMYQYILTNFSSLSSLLQKLENFLANFERLNYLGKFKKIFKNIRNFANISSLTKNLILTEYQFLAEGSTTFGKFKIFRCNEFNTT